MEPDETAAGAAPIVQIEGLDKSYGDLHVLRHVDLAVEAGTIFALLGPNGAGKTTMVGICTTLVAPDAGRVTVAGHDLAADPAAVRRSISLTGQHAAVDEFLTGRENLEMMGRLFHLGAARARARADELLEQFDLTGEAGRRVGTYSGGTRRRLDLAASLVPRPPLVFLDEPTTGLDPRSRLALWSVVRDLAAGGVTIFLTTQYLEEADQLADRIAVIDGGRIVAEGSAAELKRGIDGDSVEVGFDDPVTFAAAAQLIEGAGVEAHAERLAISVASARTGATVKQVFDVLDRNDLEVSTVSVIRPSLDDVFLALTDQNKEAA